MLVRNNPSLGAINLVLGEAVVGVVLDPAAASVNVPIFEQLECLVSVNQTPWHAVREDLNSTLRKVTGRPILGYQGHRWQVVRGVLIDWVIAMVGYRVHDQAAWAAVADTGSLMADDLRLGLTEDSHGPKEHAAAAAAVVAESALEAEVGMVVKCSEIDQDVWSVGYGLVIDDKR